MNQKEINEINVKFKEVKPMKNHFKFTNFEREVFQEHIANSIPNYDGLRRLIPSVASNFLVKNSNIYDIGCSAGDMLIQLSEEFLPIHNDLSFVGYDLAPNLLPNTDFAENCSFFPRDVAEEKLKFFSTSLVFSLFTLQFIELPKREKLVRKIYDSLDKRGAFIVCEKIYSNNAFCEGIFTFSNYDNKQRYLFEASDILKKNSKTCALLCFPYLNQITKQCLERAGFKVVEVFFKSLNFIGWVLVK